MASPPPINEQDYELLSAYLDEQLPAPERSALEERLAAEPQLRAALDGLREMIHILRLAPKVTPPRSFVLDAKSARLRRLPWWARTRVLEFTGALGAAASVLIIVLGVVLGGAPSQQPSSASAPIVPNAVVNSKPTQVVAILPSSTMTETAVADALADKAGAAEASTEVAQGTISSSDSILGGLSGAASGAGSGYRSASSTVVASATQSLKDETGGSANQSFAANPTTVPMPLAAAPASAAGGAVAPNIGSSINNAANAPQPPVDGASGVGQSSNSVLAVASPTAAPTATRTMEQVAAQAADQAGSLSSPAAQQAQAETPNAQPEQPKSYRIVPTSAATVEQKVLLATATPAPTNVLDAKLAQNSPGASQAVLIVGIVLLVLSAMLFGVGWMRSRL